jgi:hypothetical protein
MEHTSRDFESAVSELYECGAALSGSQRTAEYKSLLKSLAYYPLFAVLVLVDWVANVPIFNELLPREQGADLRWQNVIDRASRHDTSAGAFLLGQRIMFSPEVSFLALSRCFSYVPGSCLRK